jgi:stringent starvation protein B
MGAVLAIYARETGQGMALPEDPQATTPGEGPEPPTPPEDGAPRRSHLRVVK